MPSRSIIIGALCLLFVGILGLFVVIPVAQANSNISVTTTVDVTDPTDGLCSLREATAAVAAGAASGQTAGECPASSPGDTILVPSGIYTLTQGEIVITASMTISGSGQADTILDGNNLDRIFEITGTATAVDLDGLTLQNGQAYVTSTMQDNGGAIFAAGPITITNSALVSNTANAGGGIYVYTGTQALVEDSVLIENQAVLLGAAIFNGGDLVLSHTNVLSNTAADTGVIQNGWYGTPATATVENSTFAGNSAGSGGNGILNWISSTLTVTQSSFTNNSDSNGFGVLVNGGWATISNSSFDHNRAQNGAAIDNEATLIVDNTTFSNNTTAGSCGAIQSINGTADISNSTFDSNSAGYEGGAICGGVLTLTHTSLANNTTLANGGAIAAMTGDPILADAITVTNNSAQIGGGLFTLGALHLYDSQIISNCATQEGGGVYSWGNGIAGHIMPPSVVSETEIVSNTAGQGGGIFTNYLFTLTDSSLISNTANEGGGLYASAGTTATVQNTGFISNTAGYGAGLFNAGTLTVTASEFISNGFSLYGSGAGIVNNSALLVASSAFTANLGGGIFTFAPATVVSSTFSYNWSPEGGGIGANIFPGFAGVTIIGSSFDHNTAWDGGGIYALSTLTATADAFIANTAIYCGGGIEAWYTSTLSNLDLVGNSAPDGGGLCLGFHSPQTQLWNSSLVSNTATNQGGGLYLSMMLQGGNDIFAGNSAGGNGGAIYASGNLTLTDSAIYSNTAGGQGGGLFDDYYPITLSNNTISNNRARLGGGGLATLSGTISANNLTIAGNIADSDNNGSGDGGGVFLTPDGQLEWQNSILAGNVDLSSQAPDCAGTLITGGHNLIQSTLGCAISGTASGDITGTAALLGPLQDNGGPTWTEALLPGSPAIDAGSPLAPGSGGACEATDQRGVARPQGLACDIGAYEAVGLSVTASVQFAGSAFSAPQSAGSVPLTVTLSRVLPITATVQYSTADGTAMAGKDYVAGSSTLTFTPGVTQTFFAISLISVEPGQPGRSFTIALKVPSNATLGTPNTATVTVDDDAPLPAVALTSSEYWASEGSGQAVLTATLSTASALTATVQYSTTNGTALAGIDYVSTSGTLTFTPGLTETTFSVPVINDALHEADETFRVTLCSPAGASLAAPITATVTIHDDTPAPGVSFSNATYTVTNSGGAATISVTLSAASGLTAKVNFATSDGTATAGSDYTPVSGTLTFAPGQVVRVFTVPITAHARLASPATVRLTLSSPIGTALSSQSSATLTILDNTVEYRVYLPATFD